MGLFSSLFGGRDDPFGDDYAAMDRWELRNLANERDQDGGYRQPGSPTVGRDFDPFDDNDFTNKGWW